MYTIMKNGKFVEDFTDGEELTATFSKDIEFYRTKESAVNAARDYGRRHGKGYSAVKLW